MLKMATYKSCETTKQKHRLLKVLGVIFLWVSVGSAFSSIHLLTQIDYPTEAISFSYTASVRPPTSTIVWGYPTSFQSKIIMLFNNIFVGLGMAAYCFCFKSSNTTRLKKILKFLGGALLVGLFASATDFHYFDLEEWVIPVLFGIMVYLISKSSKETVVPNIQPQQVSSEVDAPIEPKTEVEDRQYMPKVNNESIKKTIDDEDLTQNVLTIESQVVETSEQQSSAVAEDNSQNMSCCNTENRTAETHEQKENNINTTIKFCRHCGVRIDYDSDKYCKYCGKQL